jgi:hypothetical protein
LTTTSVPSARVAAWARLIEAAASGASSKVRKSASTGWPSSAAIVARISDAGTGGAACCSFASSA